jgi:3-phosphoshikimate 1-carboxyvinyltransferase
MGARIEVVPDPASGPEPVGTVIVRSGSPRFVEIQSSEVAGLIDELPALAGAAAHGGGLSVTGAAELRVKESDRITALANGLRALGAEVEEFPDGFLITGARRLTGGIADAVGDHRLAMAFAIAALGASGESRILGSDAVDVSYPGFFESLEELCR